MKDVIEKVLTEFDALFAVVEESIPKPIQIPYKGSFVFRYKEKTPQQAIVIKLARCVSGLRAASLLLYRGFVQEVAALQRSIDDFQEEIHFLSLPLTLDGLEPIHEKYLDGLFWDEQLPELNPNGRYDSKRPHVSRKDIRIASDKSAKKLAERSGKPIAPLADIAKTLGGVYSGFVHGDAVSTISLYGELPPGFHLHGMLNTPHFAVHERDLWNQFYRVAVAFAHTAQAFGLNEVLTRAGRICTILEEAAGVEYPGEWKDES